MKVTVIPVIIGTLGTTANCLIKRLEELENGELAETFQTITLLRWIIFQREVLETWVYLVLFNSRDTTIHSEILSTIMTNKHTSLEKYTSHNLFEMVEKGVVCERWVGDWTDCNILTSSSSDYSSTSFSFCWAAQPGVLRAQALCWELVLTASNCNSNFNCNWLQLTRTVSSTGLYNCLTYTCFLWAWYNSTHPHVKVISWYFRPDIPVSRLTAGSKVNMLHCLLNFSVRPI